MREHWDSRDNRNSATTIGLGEPHPERTKVGRLWVGPTTTKHGKAHKNLWCVTTDHAKWDKRPVYIENGQAYAESGDDRWPVTVCDECPTPTDRDWVPRGVCYEKMDARAHSSNRHAHFQFIKENCDRCPVQLECLEYGASNYKNNVGSVWGGMYFRMETTKLAKQIDKRRGELSA